MKKIAAIALFLAVALLFSGFPADATDRNSPEAALGCRSVFAQIPLGTTDRLAETADAAMLYELNTDTLVYGWNLDGRIDPTGMVKILTALVALEQGNLEDEVTVKRSTLNTVAIGSVSANLQAGEVLTLRDLLYCVMVASANDAAAVVAEHVGGTQTAFVEMMNAKALELGCTGSYFANAHGLSGTEQYSTARDLAIITEAALENPLFAEMFCMEECTIPATNKWDERRLVTTNYMMSDSYTGKYLDSRMSGGKTAAATLTDRSLISTAEVGTSRYLCIVMSAEAEVSDDGFVVLRYGSFEETSALLDYGFQNFSVRQIVHDQQTIEQYSVSGGENDVVIRAAKTIHTVLPNEYLPEDIHFDTLVDANQLTAPIEKDASLGTLQIRYQNIVLGQCDLVAMHGVALKDSVIEQADRLQQPEPEPFDYKGLLIRIGLILAAVLLVAAFILVGIRMVRSIRVRQQHRRRMRSRRRSR